MVLSDVCMSRSSGLSRELRGVRRLKLAEVARDTRDLDTTFKVKGQGHQASLLTTVLARQAAAAVGLGRCCYVCGWRFSVVVTRWSRSTQLLYIEPC